MDLTPPQVKLMRFAIASTALLLVLSVSFCSGVKVGENSISVQWQKEKLDHKEIVDKLKGKIAYQERLHRQESADINIKLRKSEDNYEQAIADLHDERVKRVQLSKERAAVYERQSKGGPAERGDLASHTAKLDRSLEEGRGLVGELSATLRQRDEQLRLVGAQLNNDRKLLETQ